ncbi:MAG TPA: DUF5665 domain-containing protein [Candidatus Saccharibacteria bacterium]|jgi:hypothetical protein|nr:DUF5665 domain-containing protein [Candidatus Saccharibacteria bacterium]
MGTKNKLTAKDYEKLGRLINQVANSGQGTTKKLLWTSFAKGLAYGFGIFLAGTVVVGLIVWLLGLFDSTPLVGPLVQSLIDYLQ